MIGTTNDYASANQSLTLSPCRQRKGLALRSIVKHRSDSEKKANHRKAKGLGNKTAESARIRAFRRGVCYLPSETTATQNNNAPIHCSLEF